MKTNITISNPWCRLPQKEPFLLPEDADVVHKFNDSAKDGLRLHLDLLPEPFLGRPDAPVVLLNLNPGYSSPNDVRDPSIGAWNNLQHKPTPFPFYLLDPSETRALGYKWWNDKLKSLVQDVGRKAVAQSVLCIEYFPYHSRRFGHAKLGLTLPSQQYSFNLLRSALSRRAVVVVLRGRRHWLGAIPELQDYNQIYCLRNPRRPTVSRGNCHESYESVLTAIRGTAVAT
jgi:hypothetical protein